MSVTVLVPTPLQPFVGGRSTLTVEAATLRELIDGFDFEIRRRLVDEQGQLRRFIYYHVNETDVGHTTGLDTPLHDGDEVAFVPTVCTLFWEVIEREFLK